MKFFIKMVIIALAIFGASTLRADDGIVSKTGLLVMEQAVQKMRNGNLFAAESTYLYSYTLSRTTGQVNYFGYSYIGIYTTNSADDELRNRMGCSYLKQLNGSVIAPAYSNLNVELYDCSYWGAYAGVAHFGGSTSAPAIFWYLLTP